LSGRKDHFSINSTLLSGRGTVDRKMIPPSPQQCTVDIKIIPPSTQQRTVDRKMIPPSPQQRTVDRKMITLPLNNVLLIEK
jgi:hypothetical protein